MKNPIIVITGPTASGKTSLSFPVVKKFGGEVIAADSMTVYRGMDIGTDKPFWRRKYIKEGDVYIIEGIPHHLIDIKNPNSEFNVSIFRKLIEEKIKDIQNRGNIPFIVGGSLMYIDSLVYDYRIPEVPPDPKLRSEFEEQSCEKLYARLLKIDPDAQWTIDKNNKRRLVRALEVTIKSGTPFSKQKLKKEILPENILYFSVSRNREELYKNINRRVDEMFKEGFVDEVRKLYKKYDSNTAMQAAGYRQIIEFLEGNITEKEAREKTKQIHRNYAKRQLTWLQKNRDITWVKNAKETEKKIRIFLRQFKAS